MEYEQYRVPLTEVLQRACTASHEQVNNILNELNFQLNTKPENSIIPAYFDASKELAHLCYSIVRLIKPSIVVETGVGRGVSSYCILQALERNGHGHLYSIDLPMLKSGVDQDVGKLVPISLRLRWTLIFGPGIYEMKKLRKQLKNIDIFIHDSNHTYLNQLAEYQIAHTWLRRGGILISDNVGNDALLETNEKFGGQLMVIKQNKSDYLGIIRVGLTPNGSLFKKDKDIIGL